MTEETKIEEVQTEDSPVVDGKRYVQCVEPNGFKEGYSHFMADADGNNGDQWWADEADAQRWIDLGWCKCVKTGEQGERKPGASGPIQPDKVTTRIS